jgi:hypothetical protein
MAYTNSVWCMLSFIKQHWIVAAMSVSIPIPLIGPLFEWLRRAFKRSRKMRRCILVSPRSPLGEEIDTPNGPWLCTLLEITNKTGRPLEAVSVEAELRHGSREIGRFGLLYVEIAYDPATKTVPANIVRGSVSFEDGDSKMVLLGAWRKTRPIKVYTPSALRSCATNLWPLTNDVFMKGSWICVVTVKVGNSRKPPMKFAADYAEGYPIVFTEKKGWWRTRFSEDPPMPQPPGPMSC